MSVSNGVWPSTTMRVMMIQSALHQWNSARFRIASLPKQGDFCLVARGAGWLGRLRFLLVLGNPVVLSYRLEDLSGKSGRARHVESY